MRLRPVASTLAAFAFVHCACGTSSDEASFDSGATPDASPPLDSIASDVGAHDALDAHDTGAGGDAGASTRTVTHAEIVFDGTETDLAKQYDLYVQTSSSGSSIVFDDDPAGGGTKVLHYTEIKENGGWDTGHVMIRPHDKRTAYASTASLPEFEKSYHIKQKLFVSKDAQFTSQPLNLLEDNHCEPCEANNTQLMANLGDGPDSICMWIIYSTDETFDPRGTSRGGSYDPWPILGANRTTLHAAADGTTSPGTVPATGEIYLCRDDLHVSDIQGRWVELEMLMKSSSYPEKGQLKMWLDGKPYFYDGANVYRWNQLGKSSGTAAVNVFQLGLYMDAVTPATGTPLAWEIWTSPPFIEVGDDLEYSP